MGYATVTCHFLTDEWELKSVVLETTQIEESHTAEISVPCLLILQISGTSQRRSVV